MQTEYNVYNSKVKEAHSLDVKADEDESAFLYKKIMERVTLMKSERAPFEVEWKYIEAQVNAKSFYDND